MNTRRYTHVIICASALLIVCMWYIMQAVGSVEALSYAFRPTPEKSMSLAHRHFNASNTRQYDMAKAEAYLRATYDVDPRYLYVNHQLARVEFLRGNLNTALWFINKEIALRGMDVPNSYYMRGLIQGYRGEYDEAAKDYETFLASHPHNWAGLTDYAWVLLKGERYQEAADATEKGLAIFPTNPWLLNTNAIALYELGNYTLALERAKRAVEAAAMVTTDEWLTAYPGNDPRVAGEGIGTLQRSALQNMHMIEAAAASSTVQ